MTADERIDAYDRTEWGTTSPLYELNGRIYGVWLIGQNYSNPSGYYGAYPPRYCDRVAALFPDKRYVLHVFAGMTLKGSFPDAEEITLDRRDDLGADLVMNAETMSERLPSEFDLIVADTPYSPVHCEQYGVPMPNRKKVLHECSRVLKPGGHVVWLDTKFPMFSKKYLELFGCIGMWRSTNHDIRGVTLFVKPGKV